MGIIEVCIHNSILLSSSSNSIHNLKGHICRRKVVSSTPDQEDIIGVYRCNRIDRSSSSSQLGKASHHRYICTDAYPR